ncbi:MAG TPA: sugar dehydrogenase [Noviherbaspirillum sp.]|uniref:PQQ-dependent sugar dehydrogenase n=1 Tax=Noviherbaspirillum sp. TaxID=1926288 RepID=UPI002D57AB0B|nr:sugar dehydrogenase [Noviherbaspirillum sp.]HYD96304.1 sugar dehydrogenase [Noviherbaspirillum sp.]
MSAAGDAPAAAANAQGAAPAPPPAVQATAAAVVRGLEVPDGLAAPPFDVQRNLTVPPGFGIRLWARVAGARFMALAPNGDVLVSVPGAGKIVLLRERAGGGEPQSFDYATGMRNPHDMVFHRIGETTYLYVAESNRVTRSVYRGDETSRGEVQTVVDGLPDDSTPELQGRYGHQLKNIALSPDHKLYVSVASACNACAEDTQSDPVRGAIYEYSAEGRDRRLYARGLRNAEGLDFFPGTGILWVAVNNRDEVRVPLDIDVDGDRNSDLGEIVPAWVDENPPEPFTAVRDGGNYGWPFCNPVPNAAMAQLDVLADFELNRDGQALNCAGVDRASKGIRAHSAPLGFSFLHANPVPAAYRKGAAVALHGCWNCSQLAAGYKVVYFPFDDSGNAGAEIDLVTGFVSDAAARRVWGRPVDVIADARGNLLISDDYAGAIYQLYPRP